MMLNKHEIALELIKAQEHIEKARYHLTMVYANISHEHPIWKRVRDRAYFLSADNLPTENLGSDCKLFKLDHIIEGAYNNA